jgi:polar amino acid transport system substrate-binding protein
MDVNLLFRIFLFALCFTSFSSVSSEIKVGAEEWPGYTNHDGSGVYFELLKTIFAESELEFKLTSYHRTINSFNNGQLDIIVGIYREDVKNAIIPKWFIDTEQPVKAFYIPENTKINRASDFSNLSVAWMLGYSFDKFIPKVKDVYEVTSLETGFNLLSKNRVNAFIDYSQNVPKKLSNQLKSYIVLPSRNLYIAFKNNKNGQRLAEKFDKQMAKFQSNGQLKYIYKQRYDISELENFNPNLKQIVIYTEDLSLTGTKLELDTSSLENQIFYLIQQELSDYHFTFQVSNNIENLHEYSNKENTCFNVMLKSPKREKIFYFSKTSSLYMGLKLYSKEKLSDEPEIDLVKYFKEHPNTKLGLIQEQNYGEKLQAQTKKLKPEQLVFMSSFKEHKFDMFNEKEFHLMVEYPEEIANFRSQISTDKIFSYEIKGLDKYALGHMMCSKEGISSEFIKAYDDALLKIKKSTAFYQYHKSYIGKDSIESFNQYFYDVF